MKRFLKPLALFLAPSAAVAGVVFAFMAWAPDGWFGFLMFIVPTGLIVWMVMLGGFRLNPEYLAKWTKAHGVQITDANRPVIGRYLLRGRRIRTLGGLAGYVGFTVWTDVVQPRNSGWWWLIALFGGYLLGAAVAEIWAFRPQPGRVRMASLAPRRVADYVPNAALVILRIMSVLLVAFTAAWVAIPQLPREFSDFSHRPLPRRFVQPGFWPTAAWVLGALLLWIFVELTARRIARRPQPMMSEDLVAADDAIRSTAIHGLIGAGLALVLGLASASFGSWQGARAIGYEWIDTTFSVIAIFSGIAAPFAWLRLGIDQPWIVKRSRVPQHEVAA